MQVGTELVVSSAIAIPQTRIHVGRFWSVASRAESPTPS